MTTQISVVPLFVRRFLGRVSILIGGRGVQRPASWGICPTVREGSNIANEALLDSRATAPNAQADVNEKPAIVWEGHAYNSLLRA